MIDIRPFASLGDTSHDWLETRHHFSFDSYFDRNRMGWGALRVWNDDVMAPGCGFPSHPHRDMEIVTYVRRGAITHRDSVGNEGRTAAGDVQVMSAGSGIEHSEYNLEEVETDIFQIWIRPDRKGDAPTWGTATFPTGARAGQLVALASGRDEGLGVLPIRADAQVLGAMLAAGTSVEHRTASERHVYLVPASGKVAIDGKTVNARDGVAITGLETITITALEDSEIVVADTK